MLNWSIPEVTYFTFNRGFFSLEADKDVFIESSEGSDEIIDLSALSDSEQSGHSAEEETEPSQVSTKEDIQVRRLNRDDSEENNDSKMSFK